MTTSHKTKWREARMQIQQEKDKMKLPDGRTCNHCAHIEHCKWLFDINGNETVCSIYPPRFYDDVMTIYHRDGTTTEVLHPFDAMRKCEIHNHDDISGEISTDVKSEIPENKPAYNENANSLLRSAWMIANRNGEQTNWEAFKNAVYKELVEEHTIKTSPDNNRCSWIQEDNPDINLWRTSCHNSFYLDADKPSDNHMKYCCYCGKKIKEEE